MSTQVGVRLEKDQTDELDAIAERLSVKAHGLKVSRSHALRQVIERGLVAYTKELNREDAKRAK